MAYNNVVKPTFLFYIFRCIVTLPYDGAKKMILVDDVDNRQFLCELVESMWEELPKKKEKNCK